MKTEGKKVIEFSDGNSATWHPLTEETEQRGFRSKYIPRDWHWRDATEPYRDNFRPSPVNASQAQPDELDRVYRALLNALPVAWNHKQQLKKRGLKDDAIEQHGYRSLSRFGRESVAGQVLKKCGLTTLTGIPGFFEQRRSDGPGTWTIAGMSGLLIPFKDERGRIVSFQIRADNGGYFFLSSRPEKYDGGTKVYRGAHIAVPAGVDSSKAEKVWITEGGLKGNVAAEFLQEPVIAVPGVGSWMLLFESAAGILAKPRLVVVAYDADKIHNRQVARSEMALIGALQSRGHRVLVANWDVDAAGKPKGIDDLLASGGKPRLEAPVGQPDPATGTYQTVVSERIGTRLRFCAPPAWIFSKRETQNLHYAGGHVYGQIEWAVKNAVLGEGMFFLRQDPFGIGKTTAAVKALRGLHSIAWPKVKPPDASPRPIKVALLLDSSREEVGQQTVKKGERLAADIGPAAIYMNGRDETNCARMPEVRELAGQGHDILSSLCLGCQRRFKRDPGYLRPPAFIDLIGPSTEVCPYLRQFKVAKTKHIHVMHKAALLNESKRAEQMDVLIVDESLTDFLYRLVNINKFDAKTWEFELDNTVLLQEKFCKDLQNELLRTTKVADRKALILRLVDEVKLAKSMEQHRKLAQLLYETLVRGEIAATRSEALPLIDHLDKIAADQNINAKRLILSCARGLYREVKDKEFFPHERAERCSQTGRFPVRAWRALINILALEVAKPTGDHSAYVISNQSSKKAEQTVHIELRVVRRELVHRLRQRTVINLDSTPNEPLIRALFPTFGADCVNVEEKVNVIQLTDHMFGKSTATTSLPGRLPKLLRSILKTAPEFKVGILTNKATLQHLKWLGTNDKRIVGPLSDTGGIISGSENAVLGYWGRDERSTNIFESCDALIISGLHLPPIDTVERQVQAWRRFLGVPRPTQSPEGYVERAYGYVDQDGLGRSYRCTLHPDPDVAAELARIWSANLQQAIGRLRGTRSAYHKVVVVDSAMPAEGVRIHKLGPLDDAFEQPPALRAKTEATAKAASKEHNNAIGIVKPVYDQLKKKLGRSPGRDAVMKALNDSGQRLTDWQVRLALVYLNIR